MFTELDQSDFYKVKPLFAGMRWHLACLATLDGNNPGRVYADDPETPTSAFVMSVEGEYLGGNAHNTAFIESLRDFVWDTFHPHWRMLSFILSDDSWQSALQVLFKDLPVLHEPRRHYVCTQLALTGWRARLPDGFAVKPITCDLVKSPNFKPVEHALGWMQHNWGSHETFYQQGFGYCAVHNDEMVCWSIGDCRDADACEIGIHTHPDFRQRGLASVTVAALVEHLLASGFSEIGWQCSEDNVGSYKTAERVGFTLESRYTIYLCDWHRKGQP